MLHSFNTIEELNKGLEVIEKTHPVVEGGTQLPLGKHKVKCLDGFSVIDFESPNVEGGKGSIILRKAQHENGKRADFNVTKAQAAMFNTGQEVAIEVKLNSKGNKVVSIDWTQMQVKQVSNDEANVRNTAKKGTKKGTKAKA